MEFKGPYYYKQNCYNDGDESVEEDAGGGGRVGEACTGGIHLCNPSAFSIDIL